MWLSTFPNGLKVIWPNLKAQAGSKNKQGQTWPKDPADLGKEENKEEQSIVQPH